MNAKVIAALAAGVLLAAGALTHSAMSPDMHLESESAPRLFVGRPIPGLLVSGIVYIPYRVENLRIIPEGGWAARDVAARTGHLHLIFDGLPRPWADYGQGNTIILVNVPRGEHKLLVEVVDFKGHKLAAQSVKFTSPGK